MKTHAVQGFATPYTVTEHTQSTAADPPPAHPQHTPSTVNNKEGKYSAAQLGDLLGVAPVTIRTRWYKWLKAAVSEDRLKVDGKYTELAKILFQSYARDVVAQGLSPNEHGEAAREWADRMASEHLPVVVAEVTTDEPQGSAIVVSAQPSAMTQVLENQALRLDELAEYLRQLKQTQEVEAEIAQEQISQSLELNQETAELLEQVEENEHRRKVRNRLMRLKQIEDEEVARFRGKYGGAVG